MVHLFDSVTINPGETVNQTYVLDRSDLDVVLYLIGDVNSADVTIGFWSRPKDAPDGQYFHQTSVDEKNVDITDGEKYRPHVNPADSIKIEITNNGTTATVVDGYVDDYLVH